MPRTTLTTAPTELLTTNARVGDSDDTSSRTFFVTAPAGDGGALLLPGPAGGVPADFADEAALFPFTSLGLSYTLEPGVSLYAAAVSGTLELHILPGGER